MCTALTYNNGDFYFGRNLDLEYSYNETVTVTPRNYPLHFTNGDIATRHYAIIGMANVVDNYPLYYDATNEKGLSCAALNFSGNACYSKGEGSGFVAAFEFILWVVSLCDSVAKVKEKLRKIKISDKAFNTELLPSELHWIIADKASAITVEQTSDGLKIYENPVGVLTNNPEFDKQLFYLNNFAGVSALPAENRISPEINLDLYSKGLGGMFLPGDMSSASRFVRAVFTKYNSVADKTEDSSVSQFFHILGSVANARGTVRLPEEKFQLTVYSSCCNTNTGVYYYTSYDNSAINYIDMRKENLDSDSLASFQLILKQEKKSQN